jgi:hypothetical protein
MREFGTGFDERKGTKGRIGPTNWSILFLQLKKKWGK